MKKRIVLNAIVILMHISLIMYLFFFDYWYVAIFVSLPIVVTVRPLSFIFEIIYFKKFNKYILIPRLETKTVTIHLSSDIKIDKYIYVLQEIDTLINQYTSVTNHKNKKIYMRYWLIKGRILSHLENNGFKKSINVPIGIIQLIFLWYTMLWRLPLTGVAKYQVNHGMVCMFKKYLHVISASWVKEIHVKNKLNYNIYH